MHVEKHKKINDDIFLLCECFDGKRFLVIINFQLKKVMKNLKCPRKMIYLYKSNKLNLIYIK